MAKLSERIDAFIAGVWSTREPSKLTLQSWQDSATQLEDENEQRLYRLIDAVATDDDLKLTTVASRDSAEK